MCTNLVLDERMTVALVPGGTMLEAVTQPLENKHPTLPSFTQAMDRFLH